jgi:adenylate cyclase
LRLEALPSSRVFRASPQQKANVSKESSDRQLDDGQQSSNIKCGDASLLLPPVRQNLSDAELMIILDSFSIRIDNALVAFTSNPFPSVSIDASTLREVDERTLQEILSMLQGQSSL